MCILFSDETLTGPEPLEAVHRRDDKGWQEGSHRRGDSVKTDTVEMTVRGVYLRSASQVHAAGLTA